MPDNILQKVLKTGLWDPYQSVELVALIIFEAESASGMLIALILKCFYVPINSAMLDDYFEIQMEYGYKLSDAGLQTGTVENLLFGHLKQRLI